MKSPLAGIKAYVELLADGERPTSKPARSSCSVIGIQADRLQRLIDNLLNLAQIEAGAMNVSKETSRSTTCSRQTLDLVRPAAEAKQIALVGDSARCISACWRTAI